MDSNVIWRCCLSKTLRVSLSWGKAKSAVSHGTARGIQRALSILLEESRRQVPRDTGALRESGHVELLGDSGRVVYDAPYAILQHERTDFVHPHGNARYLAHPLEDSGVQTRMLDALSRDLKEALS